MGFTFITTFIFLLFLPLTGADSLIQVVGQLTGHVVTSREVKMDRVVEAILFDHPNPPNISVHADQVLLEWAIYKEAQTFALSNLPARQLNSMIKDFRSKLRSNKSLQSEWTNLKALKTEVRSLIQRKWRAKKFMEFKQQSSLAPITDEEALHYYQKQKKQYGSKSFEQVSQSIKTKLSLERAKRRIQQWHEDLKIKYKLLRIDNTSLNQ